MENTFDVFISHSSSDSKLAFAICHYLEEKEIRCWIAPRDVQGGMEYAESIINGIRNCKIMIVVFTENANNSIFVKNEVERAFNYKLTIMPFKVDEAIPSATLELFLSSVHWLDAVKGNSEDYFDILCQNCKKTLGIETDAQSNYKISQSTFDKKINTGIEIIGNYESGPIEIKQQLDLSKYPSYFFMGEDGIIDIIFILKERCYEFDELGGFVHHFRCTVRPDNDQGTSIHESVDPETVLARETNETILVEESGSWKIEDGYLILSDVIFKIKPDFIDEQTSSLFEEKILNTLKNNKIVIYKITSPNSSLFELENLNHKKEKLILKKIDKYQLLQYKIDLSDWLKKCEDGPLSPYFLLNLYNGYKAFTFDEYIEFICNSVEKNLTSSAYIYNSDFIEKIDEDGDLHSKNIESNESYEVITNEFLYEYYERKDYEEIFDNINILFKYKFSIGEGFFSGKSNIEVYLSAYPYSDTELVENLLFIIIDDQLYMYSMTDSIFNFPDLTVISSLNLINEKNIKIEYAEIIDGEISQIYYIEHKLDKKINAVINELWGKIKKK
jgi:hypothetical protein